MVGDFRQLSLIGPDRGNVFGLADQVERAQSFPYLVRSGIQGGDLVACGDGLSGLHRQLPQSAADGRAYFDGLASRLDLGDDPALMDGGTYGAGIGDFAGLGRVTFAGWSRATICGLPVASPKRTSDSAALPRTMTEESFSIFKSAS